MDNLVTGKARRNDFLQRNPYPHPHTEGFFYREKMRAIHRVAPDAGMRDILEIGGGRSGLTAMLYPHARVTNVDLDTEQSNTAFTREKHVRFVCGDAAHLPFASDSVDAVTMFDVLEHVPDDRSAISEAWRVLRTGGTLLLSSPNDKWRFPYYRPFVPLCPTDLEVMAEWGHVRRGYSPSELEDLVGAPIEASATFINPLTVIGHDLAFSRLPSTVRRGICSAVAPVVWIGYIGHRPGTRGTETAYRWRKR